MKNLLRKNAKRQAIIVTVLLAATLVAGGCRKEDMADQPRFDPEERSNFFANGQSARPLIEGTVARGHDPVHDQLFAVSSTNVTVPEATSFPQVHHGVDQKLGPIDADDLEVGHQKFDVFCSVCHGRLGNANGMVVQRGFPKPPSFIVRNDPNNPMTQRELNLQKAPVGHFYNVASYGFGAMYSYGDRIAPDDRWRIVAYIKALQAGEQSVLNENASH